MTEREARVSRSKKNRNKTAEYAELVVVTRSLTDGSRDRKIAECDTTLAENEDWLAGKPDQPVSR